MESQPQQIEERASTAAMLHDRLATFRLALFTMLLVLLVTPMGAAYLAATFALGAQNWLLITIGLFALELVGFMVLGRRALRVDSDVTPWGARLAFALVIGIVPICAQCAVTWLHERKMPWFVGAVAVAVAALYHLGGVIVKLATATRR